ncbi:MAG: hypothetical protein FWF79_01065 [Defluviitaleaceae bacterium]|nr:hypothetical protein [Defluviitaleaceae bacterium]
MLKKMLKIIAVLLLLAMFAGCGGQEDYENYPTPEPDIVNGNGQINGDNEEPENRDIPRYNDYQVSLEIDPAERTVRGISHITFTNRASVPLETIVLRVYLNAFREDVAEPPVFSELEWRAFPNERDYGHLDIEFAFKNDENLEFELAGTVLTLFLPEPLEPYATSRLTLQYSALIPRIAHRTGTNDYAMWFGMFLPVLAPFDAERGEWQTEAYYPAGSPFLLEAAEYRVEIITPMRYTVVGTGLRTEEVIADTDTKITIFTAHRVRDFAFAVSPYFNHSHVFTESGIDIHLYFYSQDLDTEEVLDIARRTMEYFEENVGIYPPGHVTIVETELFVDSDSFSQIIFVDSWYLSRGGRYWAVAHALGNQWFANVIGTNRITEPWLTNGLTRFVQAGIFYPTAEALRGRMERDFASIQNRTTLYLNRGLAYSTNRAHYAHAHGRKAMLMLYSLYHLMGHENFWALISSYYETFFFDTATIQDFISLAEEKHNGSLRSFFNEHIDAGTVPELPIV